MVLIPEAFSAVEVNHETKHLQILTFMFLVRVCFEVELILPSAHRSHTNTFPCQNDFLWSLTVVRLFGFLICTSAVFTCRDLLHELSETPVG